MKNPYLLFFTLCCFQLSSQEIELIQPLSFGTIVVGNNSNVSSIEISPIGNITTSNQIWLVEKGHHAEFVISGYPAYKQINVRAEIIDTDTSSSISGGEQFKLETVKTAPFVTTDITGKAKVYLGGTLRTTGNGHMYLNTDYSAQIQIELNY